MHIAKLFGIFGIVDRKMILLEVNPKQYHFL